jgi:hypothetical protein
MLKKSIFILASLGVFLLGNFYLKNEEKPTITAQRINVKANETIKFLKKNKKYNNEVFFLIDMKVPSNKNRFFVFDTKKNEVTDKGLVAHGSGSETKIEGQLKFGNTDGSLMTSLGKYSIGNSYEGTFGKAYKMYGLDKSNSNAYTRNIVLHKYLKVPIEEQENPIVLSWGCPMVNETFYLRLQEILDQSKKPVLLYIYY